MARLTVLLVPFVLAGITGCGGTVQVAPSGGNGGVVITITGSGPGPGTGPGAPAPTPTTAPQPPSGPTEPTTPLPQPSTPTTPPTGANPSPSPTPPSGGAVEPPLGGSSGGTGGTAPLSGQTQQAGSVPYNLIVPAGAASAPTPLLMVYSGVEGAGQMTSNLLNLRQVVPIGSFIIAVLDGKVYYGNGDAGAAVLEDVRRRYNVDNDRTYLLSESAGTSAGQILAFRIRPSYFAAYYANDVNATATPNRTASQLGFAPWGQVGPGGQLATARAIVEGMRGAGYRLPTPAPYDGPGSTQHGHSQQFIEALRFFPGKSRR